MKRKRASTARELGSEAGYTEESMFEDTHSEIPINSSVGDLSALGEAEEAPADQKQGAAHMALGPAMPIAKRF